MNEYLTWGNQTLSDQSDSNISSMYEQGYVFTRRSKGDMYLTRSIRLDLGKFSPNSENRRILNKISHMILAPQVLPLGSDSYDWQIHKLGKTYYDTKFGPGTMSASKIKELLTDNTKSNYNLLLNFRAPDLTDTSLAIVNVGYTICYSNSDMLHYAYPFYDLTRFAGNYGMGMMLNAILYAQAEGKKYIYLGSASRTKDVYKLQFSGLEWFDGTNWQTDIEALKGILQTAS